VLLSVTAARFSFLHVRLDTGQKFVAVVQRQNGTAAKEQQTSSLEQMCWAVFHTMRHVIISVDSLYADFHNSQEFLMGEPGTSTSSG